MKLTTPEETAPHASRQMTANEEARAGRQANPAREHLRAKIRHIFGW